MVLSDLRIDQTAAIAACDLSPEMVERLFALGLVIGQRLALVRRGIGGDPIQIRVGATELMLRKAVADHIEVAEAEEAP